MPMETPMDIDELKKLGALWPGSRIGIMLVHGLTGTPTEMSSVAKDLNGYGFTVFCPLLAGHCVSEAELLKTAWPDWFASVDTAFRAFTQYARVVFVGGISAGAVLSLRLAQTAVKGIRGLALYSTTFWWDGWTIPKLSFLLPLVLRLPFWSKRWRFEETWPYGIKNNRLRERLQNKMLSGDASAAGFSGTPGRSLRELWRLVDIVTQDLPTVKTPTLLLHAADDDITSIRNALYIREHLGGPSRLIALADSYHMITIDQERHQVSLETARYFFGQLTAEEKEELPRHAASHKKPESLAEPSRHPEYTSQELLAGISKRRKWLP